MHQCLKNLFFLILLLPCDSYADQAAKNTRDDIWKPREAMKSIHVKFQVKVLTDKKKDIYEGMLSEFEIWFDGERMRVDCDQTRPRDRANETMCRFAFDGSKFLVARKLGVAGEEFTNPPKDPRKDLGTGVGTLWVDPRVIGLLTCRYGTLGQKGADDLLAILSSSEAVLQGSVFSLTEARNSYRYVLDPTAGNLPTSIENKFTNPVGAEYAYLSNIRWTEPLTPAGFRFPKEIHFSAIHKGEKTYEERFTLSHIEVDEKIPADTFSWSAMELEKGQVVRRIDNGIEKEIVQWDGSGFEPWQSKPLVFGPAESNNPVFWQVLIGFNLVVLAIVMVYVRNKRRA